MIIFFSGTGNSRYCAEFLSSRLKDETIDCFDFIRNRKCLNIKSESPLIFVSPTYSWQIPHVFKELIEESCFEGNKNAYFVMTCGSDIGNAKKVNREISKKKQLKYMGTAEIIMPENYIAMFKAPRPKEAEKIINQAVPKLEKAAESILNGISFPCKAINSIDKLKSGAINRAFYPLFVKAKPFWVKSSCIGCGKCADICPLGNIFLENEKPVWGDNCTQCMACINRCPNEAIEYGKKSAGKVRYVCCKYQ